MPPPHQNGIEKSLARRRRARSAGQFIITGLQVYPSGSAKVVRSSEPRDIRGEKPKRKEISEFSRRSRERLAFVSRETIVTFHSLMTLSYGKQFPVDGKSVKVHLNRFLTWYRRNIGGEYIWWLEFQKRGAPHIHIASQKKKITAVDRQQFAVAWLKAQRASFPALYSDLTRRDVRTVSADVYKVHKHSKQWQESKRSDGPKRYILKYALKMRQKEVPENYRSVGRFYGWSRGVKEGVPEPKEVQVYETELREGLAEVGHIAADWEYLPKVLYGTSRDYWLG